MSSYPFAAQDAAFLRGLVIPREDRNDMVIQEYKGRVGIACAKSTLLFAHLIDQIGSGIGKVGVSRLVRTAKVVPIPGETSVMVFWRDLPWRDTPEDASDKSS